jgi:YcxB-like protein
MTNKYNLRGALTFEEYLECHQILAKTRRFWIRGVLGVYGSGMLLYGLLVAGSRPDGTFLALGGILLAYSLIVSPIQFRYRVKRNWDRYPRIRKDFDITVSPAGVDVLDDRENPSHSAWDNFLRFRESKSLFLLFLSPLLPLCLPKRLIAAGDIEGLRELLSSAIGGHNNGEPNADANSP